MNGDMFFGESFDFWLKLKEKADNLDASHLIRDLTEAEGKVRYYEKMIDRMNRFREGK